MELPLQMSLTSLKPAHVQDARETAWPHESLHRHASWPSARTLKSPSSPGQF